MPMNIHKDIVSSGLTHSKKQQPHLESAVEVEDSLSMGYPTSQNKAHTGRHGGPDAGQSWYGEGTLVD